MLWKKKNAFKRENAIQKYDLENVKMQLKIIVFDTEKWFTDERVLISDANESILRATTINII